MKQYDPFELALFGRMLPIHKRIMTGKMPKSSWSRFLAYWDLARDLDILDDYLEFMEAHTNV